MAHPHHSDRQSKVEHRRVGHITRGYASGGAVTATASPLPQKRAAGGAIQSITGTKAKTRADRPGRASGGRVKNGKTTVNINIAPQGGESSPPQLPPPAVAALPPPRPPIPPQMPAGGPMPGGAGPMPPMPPRATGGRAYASGGAVKSGPGWTESEKTKTPVQHDPGKSDGKDIGRGRPITYKTGGRIYSPETGAHGPKFDGGAGGGIGRLEKMRRAKRHG